MPSRPLRMQVRPSMPHNWYTNGRYRLDRVVPTSARRSGAGSIPRPPKGQQAPGGFCMEQRAGAARRGGISLDALVLVLVTGLTLHQDSFIRTPLTAPALNAIAVGLVGLYLALDVLGQPLLARGPWSRRVFYGGKGAVLAAIVGLVLIWPTCHLIALRHVS